MHFAGCNDLHTHFTRSVRTRVAHPAHLEASFIVPVAQGDDFTWRKFTFNAF